MNQSQSVTPRNLQKVGPGGIVLHINVQDAETPAMVYDSLKRRKSSTYNCALIEGMIDDEIEMTDEQIRWLAGFETQVDEAFEYARRNWKD